MRGFDGWARWSRQRNCQQESPPVPCYFLNLYDDLIVLDQEGFDFADQTAAETAARHNLLDVACAKLREGRLDLNDRIEIVDASGDVLHTLTLRDAVVIVG